MRVKSNHFILGLFYETCLVCPDNLAPYFKNVADELEKRGVKTGVIIYDSSTPLTKKEKAILSHSYSVVFWLCENVVEDAIQNSNSSFRKIFAFVNKHNPHSISLAMADGHVVAPNLKFPKDMRSFDWLHRKNMPITSFSEADMAQTLYKEFRHNHHPREERKLKRLNNKGLDDTFYMYYVLFIAALVMVIAPIFGLLQLLINNQTVQQVCSVLNFITLLAGYLSAVFIPVAWLTLRDSSLDVSTTFADFHKHCRFRLGILGLLGLLACEFQGLIFMQELLKPPYENGLLLFLVPYGILWIASIPTFIAICIFKNFVSNAQHYLEFSSKRIRANLLIIPFYMLSIIAEFIYIKAFFNI